MAFILISFDAIFMEPNFVGVQQESSDTIQKLGQHKILR